MISASYMEMAADVVQILSEGLNSGGRIRTT
jgi:hypothetical protein